MNELSIFILVIVFLIVCSAFFSSSETALQTQLKWWFRRSFQSLVWHTYRPQKIHGELYNNRQAASQLAQQDLVCEWQRSRMWFCPLGRNAHSLQPSRWQSRPWPAGSHGGSITPRSKCSPNRRTIDNKKATSSEVASSWVVKVIASAISTSSTYLENVLPGIELFSQGATPQISSPLMRFTTEFGMDRSGTTPPWTPG